MLALTPHKQVIICQNTACLKSGATQVLSAFQQLSPPDVQVEGRRCLGQCGSGPMVLVLPDRIWYSQVHSDEVPTVVERHLQKGSPVKAMLYRKFHPRSQE